MTQKLANMSAVVTGSGGGIGREVALALAKEGAQVVVNDIGKNKEGSYLANITVEDIKKNGGIAVANKDSVSSMASGENIIQTAVKNFGRIDILVNCAGFARNAICTEQTEKDWDDIMAVHLKGHFACTQPAIKEMIKQKSGRIINFSSRAGFLYATGGPGSLAYSTAKAGIVGFTIALSADLKQYGITVNGILPSAITGGFPEKRPRFGGGDLLGPEYVPPIIVYLATPEAKDITGQFFYASAGDIIILPRPMQTAGPVKFLRKDGMWTLDELSRIIPPMIDK